jgi:hypothetical protein
MAQIILDSNNNLIQGDFDNATLNNRTKLQTTTTNATTNVYVVPNGSSTSAGVSVANNSSLTNASKIVMATNGTTDTQIISGVNGSGSYLPLSFYTNNALAAQITTGGNLVMATGGITFNANPGGGTQATLNDYEVGSWTPVLSFGGGTTGITYSTIAGKYVKIGRLVLLNMYFLLSNKGSSTGSATISGMPFSTSASQPYITGSIRGNALTSISGQLQPYISPSTTTIILEYLGTGSAASVTNTNFGNGTDIMITVVYSTDS